MAARRHLALFYFGPTPDTRYNEIVYNDSDVDSTWRPAVVKPYAGRFDSVAYTTASPEGRKASWTTSGEQLAIATSSGLRNHLYSGSSLTPLPFIADTAITSVDYNPVVNWLAVGRNNASDPIDVYYYDGTAWQQHPLFDDIYSTPGEITYPTAEVNAVRWSRSSSLQRLWVTDDAGKAWRYTFIPTATDSVIDVSLSVQSYSITTSPNSVTNPEFNRTGTRGSFVFAGSSVGIWNFSVGGTKIQDISNARYACWHPYLDELYTINNTTGQLQVYTWNNATSQYALAYTLDSGNTNYRYIRWDPNGVDMFAVQDAGSYVRLHQRTDAVTWTSSDFTVNGRAIPAYPKDIAVRPRVHNAVIGRVVADDYVADDYVSDGSMVAFGSITVTATSVILGEIPLVSAFAITVVPEVVRPGSAELAAALAVAATAEVTRNAEADLSAVILQTASAELTLGAAADLTVVATTQATPTTLQLALADLSATADLTVTARFAITHEAVAGLTAAFTQSTIGGLIIEPNDLYPVTWDGVDLWANWPWSQWEKRGQHNFAQFGTAATLDRLVGGTAQLAVEATVTTEPGYVISAEATLAAEFTCEPSIDLIRGGAVLAVSAGTLEVSAEITASGVAVLASQATLQGSLTGLTRATSNLIFRAGIQTTVSVNYSAESALNTEFTLTPVAGFQTQAEAAITSESTLTTLASKFIIDKYRTITVLPETRNWQMVKETRTQQIPATTRTWLVEGYEV